MVVLLVHQSLAVRNMIKRNLVSEYGNFELFHTSSSEKAVEFLHNHKFDVALTGVHHDKTNIAELIELQKASKINRDLKLIGVVGKGEEHGVHQAQQSGIESFVSYPFYLDNLVKKIDQIYLPRKKRLFQRYAVPGLEAVVQSEDDVLKANVINISLDGVLLEIQLGSEYANLLKISKASLIFPPSFSGVTIDGLKCKAVRIVVTKWYDDESPKTVEVVCRFVNNSDRKKEALSSIIEVVQLQYEAAA